MTKLKSFHDDPAGLYQFEAEDWFHRQNVHEGTRYEYGITAETTDEELYELSEKANKDVLAKCNVELHCTYEFFVELRDEELYGN